MVESDKFLNMDPYDLIDFIEKIKQSPTINVFDYKKAISIIKKYNIKNASWGLDGDWSATADNCLINGRAVIEQDAYLNSTWAVPTLIDSDTGDEYPCYTVEDKSSYETRNGWGEDEINQINNHNFQQKLDEIHEEFES